MIKNKNIILTILGVTVLILATVGITTLLYNKSNEKTLSELPRKKYDVFQTIYGEIDESKNEYEYNGNVVKIVKSKNSYLTISINDKVIDKWLDHEMIDTIEFVDEYIFVVATFSADSSMTNLVSFDLDGNLLFSVGELDNNGMYSSGNFEIIGNKIKFSGSRENIGMGLRTEKGEIDLENCKNIEKYKEEIVRGTYEIEYIGNGKFTEPKLINSITLDEIKDEYLRYCISE